MLILNHQEQTKHQSLMLLAIKQVLPFLRKFIISFNLLQQQNIELKYRIFKAKQAKKQFQMDYNYHCIQAIRLQL